MTSDLRGNNWYRNSSMDIKLRDVASIKRRVLIDLRLCFLIFVNWLQSLRACLEYLLLFFKWIVTSIKDRQEKFILPGWHLWLLGFYCSLWWLKGPGFWWTGGATHQLWLWNMLSWETVPPPPWDAVVSLKGIPQSYKFSYRWMVLIVRVVTRMDKEWAVAIHAFLTMSVE